MLSISKFTKKYGIKFTLNHNDKMNGVSSLSTSPLCNAVCAKRAKNPEMICSHCYSITMQKRFKNLREMLEKNTEILTSVIIPVEDMPRLYSETGYFRFEAFGDLINGTQVVNYINMATANPHMKCALWTKNPWIIDTALKVYGLTKPENLTIIGSSYFVNKELNFDKWNFIDKVFTVYDKTGAETVEINCGGRSCADCGRCYENYGGRTVSELLK